jgi:hypothetical protein
MNQDFVEMLSALSGTGTEFLVVGAHALAVHARPRATGDLDIWLHGTPENAERAWRALREFGAPLGQITRDELGVPGLVYQLGVVPNRIDLLTSVTGLDFAGAWSRRSSLKIGELIVPVLGKADLIVNKRAVGRPQDLADVAELERS